MSDRNVEPRANATLGQDEKTMRVPIFMGGAAAGLIAGPFLYGVSLILWGGAVLASLAVAVVTWFKPTGREIENSGSESKEPIK